jgi:S-adenosylmethionine hydrolase
MASPIITLTSDFGRADTYVAQMKGVILSMNPAAMIVDVTHEIPPQDVSRGSLALGEVWQAFPPGTIHVAVIDPGVGTARSILGAKCADRLFILPNNGLLSHVLAKGASEEIVELQQESYWRADVSHTFHGRDIMAPVAAQLSLGVRLCEFGPPALDVKLLDLPLPQVDTRRITGEIVSIDSFGNLITNIETAHLAELEAANVIVCYKQLQVMGICETYGQHRPGTVVALLGSGGRLEVAVVNGNAAAQLNSKIAEPVVLTW